MRSATWCVTLLAAALSACGGSFGSADVGKSWSTKDKPGGACALEGKDSDGASVEPDPAGQAEIVLEVRATRVIGAISPLVYGTNGMTEIEKNHQTLVRSGGNRMTAYNWENNASNAGKDWKFQNDGNLGSSEEPGKAVTPMVQKVKELGATAIVTIPIVDYVAADKRGDGDVRNSGKDYLANRFRKNRPKKGAPFSDKPDGNDDSVYEDEFVNFLRKTIPNAKIVYALDNEPDLWADTHAEVHPDKVSYEELVRRSIDFAKAIKDVAKDAEVLGFVSYGWHGFDTLQDAPDAKQHGDFVEYFLGEMKKAEQENGRRLIDYLDLHWYPEARGDGARITEKKQSDGVIEARLQAPRSLWDPEYKESSWIADNDGVIKLIPRMMDKIERTYPGTKLAFTEWNYGAGTNISGALASADALGIFGCRGVSVAANWPMGEEPFMLAALRAYRNYDGKGAAFGDTAVFAQTSNYETSSVYASIDSQAKGRLVVLALNKLPKPRKTAVRVTAASELKSAKLFRLVQDDDEIVPGPAPTRAGKNVFAFEMPPFSVNVIALE
ncbi:MAG TPA: glycoside hydrolase family 44 protein [Polyangiaceae bacterium]|nr:glycoside hydrolase family 44 protein [Polyangiaceae bacterium]